MQLTILPKGPALVSLHTEWRRILNTQSNEAHLPACKLTSKDMQVSET